MEGYPVSWHRYEVPERFRVVAPSGAEAAFNNGYWHLLATSPTISYAISWRAAPPSEGERPGAFLEDRLDALGRSFTVPAIGVHRYQRGDPSIFEVSYREPGVVTQSRLIWQNGFFYRVDAATRGRPAEEVELFFDSFHPV